MNVVDGQRDVMNPRSAFVDVFRDRGVRCRGFEQFQRRLAGWNEMRAHMLRRHFLGHLDVQTERIAIKRQGLLHILDRNADVIETRLQR
jgi:hypothetical protein